MPTFNYAYVVLPSFAFIIYMVRKRLRRAYLPPGPPGRLFLGNLLDMPRLDACLTFEKWAHKYGPIVYLDVVGKPAVILNDYKTCSDLLDKRGAIYSDRPKFMMVGELSDMKRGPSLHPYDAEWKRHRKFLAVALSPALIRQDYVHLQQRKALVYIKTCLDNPQKYMEGIKRMTGEIATEIAYGTHSDKEYDWVVVNEGFEDTMHRVGQGRLVELIHSLRYIPSWFPGAEFKREANTWRKQTQWIRNRFYGHVKAALEAQKPVRASYVSRSLQANFLMKGDEEVIKRGAFTFFRAASGTSAAIFYVFMVAMALYPDFQKAAQAEMDEVLGESIPTLEDRDRLPLTTQILLESLRWIPALPGSLPHRVMEEDIYEGYTIPKGSMIIQNTWNISRDPVNYPKPYEFDPSRFVGFQYDLSAPKPENSPLDPRSWVFGFGRRACPGNHLGWQGLWITVAHILWSFNIKNESSRMSKDMHPSELFDLGFTIEPKSSISCLFEPRHEKVAEKVERALSFELDLSAE